MTIATARSPSSAGTRSMSRLSPYRCQVPIRTRVAYDSQVIADGSPALHEVEVARFGSQSVVPPTASQFRWTYNPGRGFIVGKATHRRTASHALLALVLIALSACTASAIEPSSPAGTVSTADAIEPVQSTASAGGPKTPDATE